VWTQQYVGRAQGQGVSIRARLSAHYNGTGNEDVDTYISNAERNNLYCRWKAVADPVTAEANLLGLFDYPWNRRIEGGRTK